jgi:hypothetical protein
MSHSRKYFSVAAVSLIVVLSLFGTIAKNLDKPLQVLGPIVFGVYLTILASTSVAVAVCGEKGFSDENRKWVCAIRLEAILLIAGMSLIFLGIFSNTARGLLYLAAGFIVMGFEFKLFWDRIWKSPVHAYRYRDNPTNEIYWWFKFSMAFIVPLTIFSLIAIFAIMIGGMIAASLGVNLNRPAPEFGRTIALFVTVYIATGLLLAPDYMTGLSIFYPRFGRQPEIVDE